LIIHTDNVTQGHRLFFAFKAYFKYKANPESICIMFAIAPEAVYFHPLQPDYPKLQHIIVVIR